MVRNIFVLVFAVIILGGLYLFFGDWVYPKKKVVKIGILHSLTGTMAVSETPLVDAYLLAVEKINQQGGVLGNQIEAIVVDGQSNDSTFAIEAEKLIVEEKVSAVFGCWTSSCRKTVKPIFEKHSHLLFYPLQHEGLEKSPNIIYTGAAPNQQIIPAIKWCFDHLGEKFYLVGSDYVFPHTANRIIKDLLSVLGGKVVGESYIPLGSTDVKKVVEDIIATQPQVIINTINGDSNNAFFLEFRGGEFDTKSIATMSFSIAEQELKDLGELNLVNDYAAWNYFQNIESPVNAKFLQSFKEKYGGERVVDDPMEAAYIGIHLWALAAEAAGSVEPQGIRSGIAGKSLMGPEGYVFVESDNHHLWKTLRIGKVQNNQQFKIVWSSVEPIRPVPFPIYRTRAEWNFFLKNLYAGWGDKWEKPVLIKN
ncbi:MAG: urea ABC transporter substrate-binding protein [Nitrospinae bacterium]|nr:urea ABC transporter substrate-binding protein [Nitrospinota bacterium]